MWKKIVLGALALVLAAAGFMVYQIGPRNVIGMIRYDQRRDGDLKVGDRAPDVPLVALDGRGRVPIVAGRTKPVILIFGSFT